MEIRQAMFQTRKAGTGTSAVAARINALAKSYDEAKFTDAALHAILGSVTHQWDQKLAAHSVLEKRRVDAAVKRAKI